MYHQFEKIWLENNYNYNIHAELQINLKVPVDIICQANTASQQSAIYQKFVFLNEMNNEMLSEYQTTHFLNLGYRYAIQFPPCIMQRYINIFCERTIAGGIVCIE